MPRPRGNRHGRFARLRSRRGGGADGCQPQCHDATKQHSVSLANCHAELSVAAKGDRIRTADFSPGGREPKSMKRDPLYDRIAGTAVVRAG